MISFSVCAHVAGGVKRLGTKYQDLYCDKSFSYKLSVS